MGETLSESEIDQLLTAITSKDRGSLTNSTGENKTGAVLSDDEIAQLLAAINGTGSLQKSFGSIEAFEKYLTEREHTPEKLYGIFDKDISVCRFFDSGENENILADIKRKNEEQGHGNIKIPNSNIELINYSFCHKCKTIFSFKDVIEYYKNPRPDQRYKNRAHQYREDTRVYCGNCDTYFLPSLVIADGTPKSEVQFLCRAQTIDEVEKYFYEKNIRVLTKNGSNIIQNGDQKAIKNDVYIKHLEEKPALITNILQYTPAKYIMNLIDGTNVEKGDLLFDEWK